MVESTRDDRWKNISLSRRSERIGFFDGSVLQSLEDSYVYPCRYITGSSSHGFRMRSGEEMRSEHLPLSLFKVITVILKYFDLSVR